MFSGGVIHVCQERTLSANVIGFALAKRSYSGLVQHKDGNSAVGADRVRELCGSGYSWVESTPSRGCRKIAPARRSYSGYATCRSALQARLNISNKGPGAFKQKCVRPLFLSGIIQGVMHGSPWLQRT